MTIKEFARVAAKEYLHSIVFVDDQIYDRATEHPVESSTIVSRFKSPFVRDKAGEQSGTPTVKSPEVAEPEEAPPYHPKQLVESFAREGMVCALYEPERNFRTDPTSEIFRLCARADVVIFDWDLYGEDGHNLLPLVTNLIQEGQSKSPYHVRLFAIYTSKPNLFSVGNALLSHLEAGQIAVTPTPPLSFTTGATRIIVLGKPGVIDRANDLKGLEVLEQNLAKRIIDEFSEMHSGILPSYALHGLACIRRNTQRILDKFHRDMDGPFLLHRASLLEHEDAFQQFPELLAEEALAVMLDGQIPVDISAKIAVARSREMKLNPINWPQVAANHSFDADSLARSYLGEGSAALEGKPRKPPDQAFHEAMDCAVTHADDRFAALFNLRTRYFKENAVPELGFGTIIKLQPIGPSLTPEYSICLMPLCDSVRLKTGSRETFPFWKLRPIAKGKNGYGLIVPIDKTVYARLGTSGKPRDMLWLDSLEASVGGMVRAERDGESFFFTGTHGQKLEWIAQLKPSHAQRVAHNIGQSLSRVAVVEAEWLRLMADGKT